MSEIPALIAALESTVLDLRDEFQELRADSATAQESLAQRLVSEIESVRELAQSQPGSSQGDAEEMRSLHSQFESQSAETVNRLTDFAGRFELLEKQLLRRTARERRFKRKLNGLDSVQAAVDQLKARFEQFGEHYQAHQPHEANRWEELSEQVASLSSLHLSHREELSGQGQRQGDLHWELARLETSRAEQANLLAEIRAKVESDIEPLNSEINNLQVQLERTQAVLADRQTMLDQALTRLAAIESERDSLTGALEGVRGELKSIQNLTDARSEETRREVAELRYALNKLVEKPAVNGSTSTGATTSPVVTKPFSGGRISVNAPLDFDDLAENILSDLTTRGEPRSATPATATPRPPAPRLVAPSIPPRENPEIANEYSRLGLRFNRSMSEGVSGETIEAARDLVEFTREKFGANGLEHALWLRNLGVCLSADGQRVEARNLLLRALAISQANAEADQLPHAVCLIDLTELHLAQGELKPAKDCCQRAITLLKKLNMVPSNPIFQRVQGFREQIERIAASASGVTRTTSIIA